MNKIGFIGMGNMAMALAAGFLETGRVQAENMCAFAPNQEKLRQNAQAVGFSACPSALAVVQKSDLVIMACKPYQIEGVLAEPGVREALAEKAMVSVAIGWDFERYAPLLDSSTRLQYILPNTPVQVGEGVFLLEDRGSLTNEEQRWLEDLLGACGTVVKLPADLISAGSAVSGCGPAFISMMMEAMADAAVKHGIRREDAYRLVAQTVIGTGRLMLESGEHPGVMKDAVCSPGGTTIRGVAALEHAGMRAAFMDAVDAASGSIK